MSSDASKQVSELLLHWGNGDGRALEAILPLIYNELRRLAHYQLRPEVVVEYDLINEVLSIYRLRAVGA